MQRWSKWMERVAAVVLVALALGHVHPVRAGARRDRRNRKPPRAFVDVNRASIHELSHVPGVGPKLAAAIVESRERHGEFVRPVHLLRVKGMGTGNAPRIARYLIFADETPPGPGESFSEPGPAGPRPTRPIDLNIAAPSDLAALPGVGWGLAYRIVDERQRYGPYRTLEDLLYLPSVTQEHVRAWRPYLYVEGR
jgi:competence protein ComEA